MVNTVHVLEETDEESEDDTQWESIVSEIETDEEKGQLARKPMNRKRTLEGKQVLVLNENAGETEAVLTVVKNNEVRAPMQFKKNEKGALIPRAQKTKIKQVKTMFLRTLEEVPKQAKERKLELKTRKRKVWFEDEEKEKFVTSSSAESEVSLITRAPRSAKEYEPPVKTLTKELQELANSDSQVMSIAEECFE